MVIFIIFILLGVMWLTIDKKSPEQEISEPVTPLSESIIIDTIFKDELENENPQS